MPVLTVQTGQAAIVDNQRRTSSPWAHTFQDTSTDVDMGSLYLNMEGLSAESAGTIAAEVAQHYFDNASLTPETALLRSVRHAYHYLYDARLESSLSDIGLTAVVVRDGRASIAQVLPTQFYLIQEEELTALPDADERLAGQEARPQQEDRHAQWNPPVGLFRATPYANDVAVLCTDNIGTVLSDKEIEDILIDGKPQSVAESLIDTARKRGEKDASVLVLRFATAKETARLPKSTPEEEPTEDIAPAVRETRAQPQGNVATAIVGVVLALVVMTWSLIASLFRPRSQFSGQTTVPSPNLATQSTIVTRRAAGEAQRQRMNRVAAGIVVLLVLVLLVIGANVLFGGEDTSGSLAEELSTTPQTQEVPKVTPGPTDAATPPPADDTAPATPNRVSESDPASTYIDELLELVQFVPGQQPDEIYGLSNTMYVLDRSTGAVYRIETTGESEVIYQPRSEGLSGSAAQHVTGRADVIQIIDSDNRLYQVSNGETPQVVQIPTGTIQQPRASATYDQNFYLLDAGANDVLRFRPVGSGVYGEPEGYFGINSGVDLSEATDLAIDGTVFIMFSDGNIKRYDSSRIAEFSLATLPSPLGTPGAIFISQGMGSLYILDGENDRVVQVTTEGVYQRQLLAPKGLFANAIDLYVNRGETYLWIVGPLGVTRVPLPELPPDAPRSSA